MVNTLASKLADVNAQDYEVTARLRIISADAQIVTTTAWHMQSAVGWLKHLNLTLFFRAAKCTLQYAFPFAV